MDSLFFFSLETIVIHRKIDNEKLKNIARIEFTLLLIL
jgi:hypothetical protein